VRTADDTRDRRPTPLPRHACDRLAPATAHPAAAGATDCSKLPRRGPGILLRRMRYRFLEFEVDTDQHSLVGPGGAIPLRRQTYRVLLHLLEHAPALVGKDALLDAVWGHQAVSQSAVAQTVRELREALGDDAERPRAIQTRHRLGYRFVAPLERRDDAPAAAAVTASGSAPAFAHRSVARPSSLRGLWIALACAAVAAAVAGVLLRAPREDAARGWPVHAAAAAATREALQAWRHVDPAGALAALARARGREDTPRLALAQARIHVAQGRPADAARLLDALDAGRAGLARRDQLLLAAAREELHGRHAAALEPARIAFEIDPADLDIGLALFELQHHEHAPELATTRARLDALPALPPPRRLLMAAQVAGRERRFEVQATQAAAARAAAGTRWPALAALARAERARAWIGLGRIDEGRAELRAAAADLARTGLARDAVEVQLDDVEPALARGDLDATGAALEALERPVWDTGDAYLLGRILHARGRLAARAGQHEAALALYTAAAAQHEAAGNTAGVASALSAQSGPLRRLGRTTEARAALERALAFAATPGSAAIAAGIHGNLANLHAQDNRLADATREFEAALALFRALRDRRQEAVTLGNLSNMAMLEGDVRRADDLNRQALAIFRALDLGPDIARTQVNLAAAALVRGELDAVEASLDEAIGLLRRGGHPGRLGAALAMRAEVRLRAADLPGASALLDDAAALPGLDPATRATIASVRGWRAEAGGDLEGARLAYREALALREQARLVSDAQSNRLDLARLDLAAGGHARAEQAATAVAARAHADGDPPREREARLVLAEALLGQGRRADAERALVAARALLDRSPQFDSELHWALLRARLDRDPTERALWVEQQAQAHGHRRLALRVRGERLQHGPDAERAAWEAEIERLGLAPAPAPTSGRLRVAH